MGLIYLRPCEYRVFDGPAVAETLVGSCVCVCLYNRTNGMAAMNHYLRARDEGRPDCNVGEFGSLSTVHIIKELMAVDPVAGHYKAQVFGGAAVLKTQTSTYSVGENNIDVALEVFKAYRIRVIRQDVGGDRGRRVRFDTATNIVECRFAGDVGKGKRLRIGNEE